MIGSNKTTQPSEVIQNWVDLLRELGREGNNPTETELIMGCRDAARAIGDALSELVQEHHGH